MVNSINENYCQKGAFVPDLLDYLRLNIKTRGFKLTRPRKAILNALYNTKFHASVDDIYSSLSGRYLHSHFVYQNHKEIVDCSSSLDKNKFIEEIRNYLSKKYLFRVHSSCVYFYGACRRCLRKS